MHYRDAWTSVKGTTTEEAWAKYVEKLLEVIFVNYSKLLTFIIVIDPSQVCGNRQPVQEIY